MNLSSLSCDICCMPYDTDTHDPRIIPTCYHTLCLSCIKHLIKPNSNKMNCPFCKKEFKSPQLDPSCFPKNYAISSGYEKKDVCKEHSLHFDIVCITCQLKICNRCYLRGSHKDHEIEYLEDLTREISTYISDLDVTAKRVEKYNSVIKKILNLRRQTLKYWVELKFKSLLEDINKQMKYTLEKIDAYFSKIHIGPTFNTLEQEEFKSKFININQWRDEVNELLLLWEKRDPFETNSILKKKNFHLSDINNWLNQEPQLIAKNITKSIGIKFNQDLVPQFSDYCQIIVHQEGHDFQITSEIHDPEIEKLFSNYMFGKHSEDQLAFQHNFIKSEAKLDEIIRETNFITLGPVKSASVAESLNPLRMLMWNFQDTPTLSIQLQESKLPQDEVQKIFDCLACMNPEDIDINLSDSAQMGQSLSKFSDYMVTSRNLSMLSIIFKQCFVFDSGIQHFTKSLIQMNRLQELTIDLEECLTVSSDDFTNLFQSLSKIPGLRYLSLNLTKCDQFEALNVSDLIDLICSFDVEKFRGLSLLMGFLDKHFLSKSLLEKLFASVMKLQNLSNLKLFLRDNEELNDDHLGVLASGLPSMKKLTNLDLNFDFYQLISEKRMLQRAQLLKSTKKKGSALSPETSGYISDDGIAMISKAISSIQTLTFLKLDFSGYERLTDDGVCKLYQSVQNLKNLNCLDVSFDQCYLIGDGSMKSVSKCIFTLSKLSEVRIRFENSEISSKGISLLERSFAFLTNVSKLCFGFCCSSKEIDSIKAICKTISSLKTLKSCNLTISLTDKANNIDPEEFKEFFAPNLDLSINTKFLFKS